MSRCSRVRPPLASPIASSWFRLSLLAAGVRGGSSPSVSTPTIRPRLTGAPRMKSSRRRSAEPPITPRTDHAAWTFLPQSRISPTLRLGDKSTSNTAATRATSRRYTAGSVRTWRGCTARGEAGGTVLLPLVDLPYSSSPIKDPNPGSPRDSRQGYACHFGGSQTAPEILHIIEYMKRLRVGGPSTTTHSPIQDPDHGASGTARQAPFGVVPCGFRGERTLHPNPIPTERRPVAPPPCP